MKPLLGLALLASASAMADETVVFVCEGPSGKVYTNHPCDMNEKLVGAKQYHNDAPAPSPGQFDQWRPSQQQPNAPQYVNRAQPAQREQTASIDGYQCSGNGKTWVQEKPCPDSTVHGSAGHISGFDQYGNHISGTALYSERVPVEQQALSHDELCTRLQQHMQTSEKDKGQSSVYERNKQRQLNGC